MNIYFAYLCMNQFNGSPIVYSTPSKDIHTTAMSRPGGPVFVDFNYLHIEQINQRKLQTKIEVLLMGSMSGHANLVI